MDVIDTYYKKVIIEDKWPQWWINMYLEGNKTVSIILEKYDAIWYFNDGYVNHEPTIPVITFTTKDGYVRFFMERT